MIDPVLVKILRCPATFQEVTVADSSLVEELNWQIADQSLRNLAGKAVAEPMDGGLIRADRQILFPVWQDVPVMIVAEAIPLPPAASPTRPGT